MSVWLRSGTASFTNGSASVAFSGVDIIDSGVNVGDALHAPDGAIYEISAIDSSTALTLASNYAGSTSANQAYAIQPTRGVAKSLSDNVSALLSTINGHLTGALSGSFPSGTSAAPSIRRTGDENTGLHWPGNNQLGFATAGVTRLLLSNSAADLSVPLTGDAVQQAPDDVTAGRLMRADWGFGPGNVLGPVSEAAGQPTGALIETGDSSSGTYIRWANGTQICHHQGTLAYESAKRLSDRWTFPASFSEAPACFGFLMSPNTSLSTREYAIFAANNEAPLRVDRADFRLWSLNTTAGFQPSDSTGYYALAVGKWFQ